MKLYPFVILLSIGGCFSLGFAVDEPTVVLEPQPSAITTARILGDLPDGTPPTPEPPKPEFIVQPKDILETKIHEQGGRKIIVQKITPIALPPPPPIAAAPVDIDNPAIQERVATVQAKYPDQELLFVGASVFHAKDATVRSLVRIWPLGKGEPVTFWSSADFALLSGFASFVGSDGETHSLIMSWSTVEIDTMAGFIEKQGGEYGISKAPELTAGKATFAVTSEKPAEAALTPIQALHDLYNNEHARLKTAYEGRERARIQHEAELKTHPPKPKDITINHWRIAPAGQAATGKGAAR